MATTTLLNTSGLVVATGIDLLILVLIFLNVLRGRRLGLPRQVFSDIGFFVGMFLGVQLVPLMVFALTGRPERAIVTLATVIGVGIFVGFVGDRIGSDIMRGARILFNLPIKKSILGAVLSGATTLIVVWLISAMVQTTSVGRLATGLQRSLILRGVTSIAPAPPDIITHIQTLIDPNGFPQVFVGLEPVPTKTVSLADQAAIDRAVTLAGSSTVRIEGLGCGGLVSGTGFVVAPGTVMTAAHIIAGIKRPLVIDQAGVHTSTVIWFDSQTDVALLRADNLAGRPLKLTTSDLPPETHTVVLGYPDGGPFTGEPAGVLGLDTVTGYNIYGRGEVDRRMYILEAAVRSGNSGGPVVLPDGSVIGMVIARSLVSDRVGYALASSVLEPMESAVAGRTGSVGTGSCTAP